VRRADRGGAACCAVFVSLVSFVRVFVTFAFGGCRRIWRAVSGVFGAADGAVL